MGFKGSKVQTFSSRPTGKSGTYVKTRVTFFVSRHYRPSLFSPYRNRLFLPDRPALSVRGPSLPPAYLPVGYQGAIIFSARPGPCMSSQEHVFITDRPPGAVFVRSGGQLIFRPTVRHSSMSHRSICKIGYAFPSASSSERVTTENPICR